MNIDLTRAQAETVWSAMLDKRVAIRASVADLLHSIPALEAQEAAGEGASMLVTSNGARHMATLLDEQDDRITGVITNLERQLYGRD